MYIRDLPLPRAKAQRRDVDDGQGQGVVQVLARSRQRPCGQLHRHPGPLYFPAEMKGN